MKRYGWMVATIMCVVPAAVWAGGTPGQGVPTLGEAGLVTVGLALLGGGVALLRKR